MNEKTKLMLSAAGIDVESIQTEDDYRKAFATAGNYVFSQLIASAQSGDEVCRRCWTLWSTTVNEANRRQMFKVIPGGITAPN